MVKLFEFLVLVHLRYDSPFREVNPAKISNATASFGMTSGVKHEGKALYGMSIPN